MTNAQKIQSADDVIQHFNQVNYLQVTVNQDTQRIDNFLFTRLKGLPKSHVYKLLRNGEVRVNKKRVKAQQKLALGDVVRIAPIRLNSVQTPQVGDKVASALLDCIVFEDEHIIVLNKPAGIAVHGGSGQSYGVIEALRIATHKKYLELIHRIDKETSGLLLIAKKRSALKKIQAMFREKTIQKSYQAILYGKVTPKKQQVDAPLKRYLLANGERRVKVDVIGKASQTDIEVVNYLQLNEHLFATHIIAKPHTGRTHQIRVHCLSMGHAILGDKKYQPQRHQQQLDDLQQTDLAIKRLCLHAWRLTLPDYGCGQTQHFEAPLPIDMAGLINNS